MLANWYDGIAGADWDMIVSNPPYVAMGDPHLTEGDLRFEPSGALASGVDGLAALRTIVAGARARLVPGGALIVEHGFDQSAAVQGLLRDAEFDAITVRRDLAGIARVAAGKRAGIEPRLQPLAVAIACAAGFSPRRCPQGVVPTAIDGYPRTGVRHRHASFSAHGCNDGMMPGCGATPLACCSR